MNDVVRRLGPICEAVARMLSPHGEVVLHDPATDRVLGIWNALSGRSPGEPSLLGDIKSGPDVLGPYPKTLADGRNLASVSAIVRDAEGVPEAVLCLNVDRTAFEEAARFLAGFAAPVVEQPGELFDQDWTEQVNAVVGGYVRECGTPVERLGRAERLAVLTELEAAGVFGRRRAVPTVARALRLSRSAVYQLLAEIRKDA